MKLFQVFSYVSFFLLFAGSLPSFAMAQDKQSLVVQRVLPSKNTTSDPENIMNESLSCMRKRFQATNSKNKSLFSMVKNFVGLASDTSIQLKRSGQNRIRATFNKGHDLALSRKWLTQPMRISFHRAITPDPGGKKYRGGYRLKKDNLGENYLVKIRHFMSGEQIVDAQPGFDNMTGAPIIRIRFNDKGRKRLAKETSAWIGQLIAVVVDEKIISAPRVMEPIFGGSLQISGDMSIQEVNDLSFALRNCSLPASFKVISEN